MIQEIVTGYKEISALWLTEYEQMMMMIMAGMCVPGIELSN